MGNLAYSNFSVGHSNAGFLEYVMGVLDDMERDADNHVDYPVALKKFVEVYGIDDFQKLGPENSFHWDNPVLDSFFPCFPSDEPDKSYDSVIECMHRDIKTDLERQLKGDRISAKSQNPLGFTDFDICWQASAEILETPRTDRIVLLTIADHIISCFKGKESYWTRDIDDYFETRDFDTYVETVIENVEVSLAEERAYSLNNPENEMLIEAMVDLSHSKFCCIPILSIDECGSGYGFEVQDDIYEHFSNTNIDCDDYLFAYNLDQNIIFPEFLEEDLEFLKDGPLCAVLDNVRVMPRQRAKEFSPWAQSYHDNIASMQRELVLKNDK